MRLACSKSRAASVLPQRHRHGDFDPGSTRTSGYTDNRGGGLAFSDFGPKDAINARPTNPEPTSDVGRRIPAAFSVLISSTLARAVGFLPRYFPSAFALAIASRWRSRSKQAIAPITVIVRLSRVGIT
jgi:hypothetical protein